MQTKPPSLGRGLWAIRVFGKSGPRPGARGARMDGSSLVQGLEMDPLHLGKGALPQLRDSGHTHTCSARLYAGWGF